MKLFANNRKVLRLDYQLVSKRARLDKQAIYCFFLRVVPEQLAYFLSILGVRGCLLLMATCRTLTQFLDPFLLPHCAQLGYCKLHPPRDVPISRADLWNRRHARTYPRTAIKLLIALIPELQRNDPLYMKKSPTINLTILEEDVESGDDEYNWILVGFLLIKEYTNRRKLILLHVLQFVRNLDKLIQLGEVMGDPLAEWALGHKGLVATKYARLRTYLTRYKIKF